MYTQPQLAIIGLCVSMYAIADTVPLNIPASVDTSRWDCDYCTFEQGLSGELELGIGYVSDPSYKFGEYNSLYEDGAYAVANGTARYRDDADYFNLDALDLGLENRWIEAEGGRQGVYNLYLNYDGISRAISDSTMTPYLGDGSNNLTLPGDWVPSNNTAGMTQLDASLHDANLKTLRKRVGYGLSFIPAAQWEAAIDVRHEFREGQQSISGAFLYDGAELVKPVDYVTDEVQATVKYTAPKWQSVLSYYVSLFNNANASLTWENAFDPITPGADAGQMALSPDNQFHQIMLSSGYQFSDATSLSGDIAIGRMEQDEDLLQASINPNLDVALPRTSAQARIDTLTANLKLDTALSDKTRLSAAYRYNDRDNKTPSDVFEWVITDTVISPDPRYNLPYSFIDQIATLDVAYNINRKTRFSAGFENAIKRRTNQQVDKTTENTLWGKFDVRTSNSVDIDLRAAHGQRDGSGYHPVAEIEPPENPLMRKYNLADRTRDTGSINVTLYLHERISINLGGEFAMDDYSDSVIGLTSSEETLLNADFSMLLTEVTSLSAYVSWQDIQSEQAGSDTGTDPDWFASNDDTVGSFGIGLKHQLIENKLDVGVDYYLLQSTGQISIVTGTENSQFPDLETDLRTLKLYGDYKLKDNLTLHAEFWNNHYTSSNWMFDGVDPATIPNVLSFGEQSPSYNVNVGIVSARYSF